MFTTSTPDEVGQITTFQNASSGTNLVYAWDFGDGGSSTEANPSHSYSTVGTYSVTLTITNTITSDTVTQGVSIVDVPISGLVINSNGTATLGQMVDLSASVATGTNVEYSWTFGDGTAPQAGSNVQHTYATAGPYTIQVTAVNSTNSQMASADIVIQGAASNSNQLFVPLLLK